MIPRRSADGFNLSFLDVMACGLGAVILIFMLVKFNASTDVPTDELQRLQQELEQISKEHADLLKSVNSINDEKTREQMTLADIKARIAQLQTLSRQAALAITEETEKLAGVEKALAEIQPAKPDDAVVLEGVGEESYLLGLKVEGRSIGILLDNSASMSDEKLLDIIRSKINSDEEKRAAEKWQRTRRVVRWLLARVPQSAKLSMVSFNESAQVVGPQDRINAGDSKALNRMVKAVDELTPENGTNLQAALKKIIEINPDMTNLYVITDGLPTLGENGSGLRMFSSCDSFFGRATTITGECRLNLFKYTIDTAPFRGVQVNVILLPLEGDPAAPDAYWNWAARTGGLFISPARSWP